MDVVADAYFGKTRSKQLEKDTRERIDWLVKAIAPGSVLDIGCSQGVLAILLARRGDTEVTGIDCLDVAVADAERRLADEPQMVRRAVRFAEVDFLEDEIAVYQGCFDTVVIGQVLEHVSDPAAFVARAVSCMLPGGHIVISVPYGVWDHDEHEETFFVHTLFNILNPLVSVIRIELVGGRLAMVGTLEKDTEAYTVSPEQIWNLERQFFIQKERRLLERNERLLARNAQLMERTKLAPHKSLLLAAADSTKTLSRKRYLFEKERAKRKPPRYLLLPLHWLRLQLGMRVAGDYAKIAEGNPGLKTVVKEYFYGPERGRFHRKDSDLFFSETLPLLLAFFDAELCGKGADLEAIESTIRDVAPEPQASLLIFRLYQTSGDLFKALALCRGLLAGRWGTLQRSAQRKLQSEPVARLLAGDLLPEKTIEPAFIAGSRIGYVVHSSLPFVTAGYTTRTHGFADGLRRHGEDVVTITRPGFPLDVIRDLSASDIPLSEEIDFVSYRRILEPLKRGKFLYEYIHLAADSLEKAFVAEGVKTVIAASNHVCALPAIIAARRLGLPCVYEVRGFWEISAKSRDETFGETADFATTVEMERLTACAADRVLTLTAGMKEELIRRGVEPERIFLAPNGFRPTMLEQKPNAHAVRTRLNIPDGCPVIGYIGSITHYEGLDDLANACVGLNERGIDFRLLIVGDEKSYHGGGAVITEQMTNAFAAANISEKLIMTGRVPFEHVPDYYGIVDIAPIPRKPFEVSELVSPIKPLEAMAFGKALVVSSVAALTEIVTDGVTGYVFEKGNVGALRDTLIRAITEPITRRQIAANGKRFALQERVWEKIAGKVTDFLLENGRK